MNAALKTLTAGISLLALAACGGESGTAVSSEQESATLPGGGTVKEIVETRHESMEKIGKSFKAISDQLKAASPDLDTIKTSAAFIAEKSTEVGDWFPPESSPALGVKTHALAAIWEQPEEFAADVAKFEIAAAALDAAAQSGDVAAIGAAFKETGGACKSCHESFREDDH